VDGRWTPALARGVEGELDEEADDEGVGLEADDDDEGAGLESGDDGAVAVMLGVTGNDADTMDPGVAGEGEATGADADKATSARNRERATTGVSTGAAGVTEAVAGMPCLNGKSSSSK
jgi:hypothetical protein